MINIYSSTSVRNNSTTQDFMNDLAAQWDNWHEIVYDTTDPTLVTELWVTDEIYIYLNSGTVKIKHKTRTAEQSLGSGTPIYSIVVTDKGLLAFLQSSNMFGKAILIANTSSDEYGLIYNNSGSNASTTRNVRYNIFTNGMRLNSTSEHVISGNGTGVSAELIQLIDIINPYDTVTFNGAYVAYITPQNVDGKVSLNNKNYYINYSSGLALEYTDD